LCDQTPFFAREALLEKEELIIYCTDQTFVRRVVITLGKISCRNLPETHLYLSMKKIYCKKIA
jgi:hypothetical protein